MTSPLVYDAGALIALADNDRRMYSMHATAVQEYRQIFVPAVVVAQVWRDARRQVSLGKALAATEIVPVGAGTAKAAGVLCGRAGTRDVVDAIVVVMAATNAAIVFTSDPGDMKLLADAYGVKPGLAIRKV